MALLAQARDTAPLITVHMYAISICGRTGGLDLLAAFSAL